ncbi:MAG TPA: ribbon-helix-helix protein, CopG family [Tepidisphaeraceae bacterium]|nr:ribbon-helix-helix protein, CopG family [Tepidisphaeraceae bacterium]
MKSTKNRKRWTEMSLAELRDATKQFDTPIPYSATRPLTPAQRTRFERAQRSSLKREKGSAKTTIAVNVDVKLLKRLDEYAILHGLSRSELLERGLRGMAEFVAG